MSKMNNNKKSEFDNLNLEELKILQEIVFLKIKILELENDIYEK